MPKVLGVIPARLASTRLPGKMLALINGKPLVYWTWFQAKKAKMLDDVVVATESPEIYDAVKKWGGRVVMTPQINTSGSDRVATAIKQFPWARIIINIQGDEPLVSPSAIDALVRTLIAHPNIPVATLATKFKNAEDLINPGNGKVVLDRNQNALYFSRAVIPYARNPHDGYLKHIGMYGFQRAFLMRYPKLDQTPSEKAEGLEQLRILENGFKIKVIVGEFSSISVDTPADLARVRRIFKKNELQK